jgi:tetratricopeptide (TPR) repeat protein
MNSDLFRIGLQRCGAERMKSRQLGARLAASLIAASALLPMPITAPAQETQPPDWDQICRNAAPDTPLRNRCGQIEGACTLRKLTSQLSGSAYSPQACLAEGMNAAQSLESGSTSAQSPPEDSPDHRACQDSTEHEAIIRSCSAALASGSDSKSEMVADLLQRGGALLQAAQYDRAITDFSAVIEIVPTVPLAEGTGSARREVLFWAYVDRCEARIVRVQLDDAVADCTKAMDQQPSPKNLSLAYRMRGTAYRLLGTARNDPALTERGNRDRAKGWALDP